jgi:hypothetical protein
MNRHRITLTTALAALAILAAGCVLPTGTDTVGVFVGGEKIGPDYKRGSIDKVTRIDDDVRVEGWATSYGFNANRNPASLVITLMNDDGIIISTATPVRPCGGTTSPPPSRSSPAAHPASSRNSATPPTMRPWCASPSGLGMAPSPSPRASGSPQHPP